MLKGTALVFLSRNYQKAVAALIVILLARSLDERAVGVYGLLVSTITILAAATSLGLGPSQVYLRGQGRMSLRQALGTSLLASLVLGGAGTIVFTLLRPLLEIEAVDPVLLTLVSLVLPLTLLQGYIDFIWQGEDRLAIYSGLFVFRATSLLVLLLLGLQLPNPYVGIALALVLNPVVVLSISLLLLQREYGLRPEFTPRLAAQAVRYGLRIHPGTVAQAVGYRADYLLINFFLTKSVLGLYVIATNVAEALWMVPYAISAALLPKVATRDASTATAVTARSTRVVLAVSLLSGGIVFALAPWLLTILFGPGGAEAVGALRLLLVGTVVFSVQKVLANYFIGQGKASWFLRATLTSMAVNLALNLWLIPLPDWGIEGAALASAISYSLSTAILTVLFVRWSDIPLRDVLVINRQDLAEAAGGMLRLRRRAEMLGHRRAAR